ncbi:hypothetical protein DYB26_015305, partial [Aphanomyces astaci]
KAGLTANLPDVEPQKAVYIEDKWSWSSYVYDPLARKRLILGSIGCFLLLLSFYFGYKAGTTAPGVQTLSTPQDLIPNILTNDTTLVRVKIPRKHKTPRHDGDPHN